VSSNIMVFVDWASYGICKYWMLGQERRCYSGSGCHWSHPPRERIRVLWEYPEERQKYLELTTSSRQPVESESRKAAVMLLPLPARMRQDKVVGARESEKVELGPPARKDVQTRCKANANRQPLGRADRAVQRADVDKNGDAGCSLPSPREAGSSHARMSRTKSDSAPDRNGTEMEGNGPADDSVYQRQRRVTKRGDGERQLGEVLSAVPYGVPIPAHPPAREGRPKPRDGAENVDHTCTQVLQNLRMRSNGEAAPALANVDHLVRITMGASKRMSNGEAKPAGPHPSTIRVAAPYMSQAAIESRLQRARGSSDAQERSVAEAREDRERLAGVTWLDQTRRALQLPVRTLTTAATLYHRFRLAHSGADYAWPDAAAASLLAACKVEDTLKKSRDILAAAYQAKAGAHDALPPDDVVFDAPSRAVIGLERLVLEAGGFDFRAKAPHRLLVKLAKALPPSPDRRRVAAVAWTVLTDLNRTFALLKQTAATLALASLELAAHLHAAAAATADATCEVRDHVLAINPTRWSTTREEVMETLLDALDLYTHHTAASILGTKYSLDDFLRIRLALNKECAESNLPRYTTIPEADRAPANGNPALMLKVANGHPTPVSPPDPSQVQQQQTAPGGGNVPPVPDGGGTLRFVLNPQLASDEKAEVQKYFVEEWEEYDEEIEVPLPKPAPPPAAAAPAFKGTPDRRDARESSHARDSRAAPPPPPASRTREVEERRGGVLSHSHEPRRSIDEMRERRAHEEYLERERMHRSRDSDRDRRYDDRRYEGRGRYDGGSVYEDSRRRERR